MFGSQILEIAIGLIFVYWLMSLMCYALNEAVAGILSWRAKDLEKYIRNLLNDPDGTELAKKFYDHGLIQSLRKKSGKKPSYISPQTFAMVLTDILSAEESKTGTQSLEDMRKIIADLPFDKLKQTLLTLIDDAQDNLKKAKENIESWFNATMERASGWYKRKVQLITVLFAILLTGIFNVDTITVANTLSEDATLRSLIVTQAEEKVISAPKPEDEAVTVMNEEIEGTNTESSDSEEVEGKESGQTNLII